MRVQATDGQYEEEFGRAGRFVARAHNTFRRCLNFYGYTSDRALNAMVGYAYRVQRIGRQVISREERAGALSLIYGWMKTLQGLESVAGSPGDAGVSTTGDAEQTLAMKALAESSLGNRRAAADYRHDPAFRHLLDHHPDDEYVDFRDPAVILSRYKIRASEHLKTVLPPRKARQYVLTTDIPGCDPGVLPRDKEGFAPAEGE